MTALATLADFVILTGAVLAVFAAFGATCDLVDSIAERLRRE